MSILKIKTEPFKIYLVDTTAELTDLSAPRGSFALCLDTSVIHIRNIDEETWTETTLTSLPM